MKPPDLERLYRDHGPAVLRRARQILHNDDEARDALQEIFVTLAGQPLDLSHGATAWFYVRTTRLCLNRLRNARTRARIVAARGEVAAHSAPGRGENLVLARDVLAHLPDELAEAAVYYYCDEMTHDEIAAMLGCSRRHVGHLLERFHAQAAV